MNKRSNHWITGLTLALCALATGAGAQGSATADFIDNVASAEYLDGAGGDRRQAESNRARIPFNSEIALTLVKTSGDRNGDTLRPGERLDYRITLDSSGAAPPSRSLRVDGADALGVLLADTVPANTELDPAGPNAASAGELILQLRAQAGSDDWIRAASWDGFAPVARVAALLAPASLGAGARVTLEFAVVLLPRVTRGTSIRNTAGIDLDGDGEAELVSNTTVDPVDAVDANGEPFEATIRFLRPTRPLQQSGTPPDFGSAPGAELEDTERYRLDHGDGVYDLSRDGVYVEVTSNFLNDSAIDPETGDGNGIYTVTLVTAAGDTLVLQVMETGPNTGVFRSIYPVALVPRAPGAPAGQGQCPATLAAETLPDYAVTREQVPECVLAIDPGEQLSALIANADGGQTTISDVAAIDPLGRAIDSVTGAPIANVGVRVCVEPNPVPAGFDPSADCVVAIDPATGLPLIDVTDADGRYGPLFADAPGCYYIDVDVSGVADATWPSTRAPADVPPQPPSVFDGSETVIAPSYGAGGFPGAQVVHGGQCSLPGSFFLPPDREVALPIDIATPPASVLGLSKRANRPQAGVGDRIRYDIEAVNGLPNAVDPATLVDTLPYGFAYVAGTTRVDGVAAADPASADGRRLEFALGALAPGQRLTISYLVSLRPGAIDGDGVNRAELIGTSDGQAVGSGTVSATVRVDAEPLFSSDAHLFGTVYVDANCDQTQGPAEWPIAGVRLYMEDGTWVITDENGQYSLYGVRPGNRVIKLDATTLPEGLSLKPIDNRHAADPGSRFVDLRASEFHRADFATACACEAWDRVERELAMRSRDSLGDWMLERAENYRGTVNAAAGGTRDLQRRGELAADGRLSGAELVGPADTAAASATTLTPLPAARLPMALVAQEAGKPAAALDPAELVESITRVQAEAGTWLLPAADQETDADGRFLFVTHAGLIPVLLVNGEPVDDDARLGARLENRREAAQLSAWYGVSLRRGWNTVAVAVTDGFGNRRVIGERRIYRAGDLRTLRLKPRQRTLDADGGRSHAVLDLELLDAEGQRVRGVHHASIEAGDGRWLNTDLQPEVPGTQIRVDDGHAALFLQSGLEPRGLRVRASVDALRTEAEIDQVAPMRELIAVGLIDIGGRVGSLGGSGILPTKRDEFDEGFTHHERGALFLKGKVKGDVLLTLSYDSDKTDETELFRDIDPNAYYPIYGDASRKGYDAQSRDQLFVRVERGTNSLMWGDYLTDSDGDGTLASSRRALTGANLHLENERAELQVFGAPVSSARRVEEIPGNGTATDYRIAGAPIVPNSETVELIERDRDNRGLIVRQETLSRFGDYNLDEREGFLRFNRPIASQDPLTGNPLSIRVSYDAERPGAGGEHLVAGARLGVQLSDALGVGLSYTQDNDTQEGSRLGGAHVDYAIGQDHRLRAEVGHMSHRDPARADGRALRLAFDSRWGSKLETRLLWGRAEAGFSNRDGSVSPDRSELMADARLQVTESTDVKLRVQDSRSLSSDEQRRGGELSVGQRLGLWRLELGLRHTSQRGLDSAAGAGDNDDVNAVSLRAERSFTAFEKAGNVHVEVAQDTANSDRREVQFGAEYAVHEHARVYGRHEIISSLSGFSNLGSSVSRSNTVIGVASDLLPSTQTYSEYRQRGGIDGRELETANGIRGSIELAPDRFLSPAIEYIETREGPNPGADLALSLGYSDRSAENHKLNLRGDLRFGRDSDFYGFVGSYAARLNLDWTSILREEFAYEQPADGRTPSLRHAFSWGVARRPRNGNVWHMLGLYQWKQERNRGSERRDAHVLSTHQNVQVGAAALLSANLAGKWQRETLDGQAYDGNTQLAGLRLILDLDRRFDLDVHGAALGVDGFAARRYAAGVGLHYLADRNLRLGIGYNIAGFRDEDLDSQGYYAPGVYFGIQFKFDEHAFGWLRPDQDMP